VQIIHSVAVSALVAQLVLQGAATNRAESASWQEGVGRLDAAAQGVVGWVSRNRQFLCQR
jgi:hypothetical protein